MSNVMPLPIFTAHVQRVLHLYISTNLDQIPCLWDLYYTWLVSSPFLLSRSSQYTRSPAHISQCTISPLHVQSVSTLSLLRPAIMLLNMNEQSTIMSNWSCLKTLIVKKYNKKRSVLCKLAICKWANLHPYFYQEEVKCVWF